VSKCDEKVKVVCVAALKVVLDLSPSQHEGMSHLVPSPELEIANISPVLVIP
jgi:hypothetical protein